MSEKNFEQNKLFLRAFPSGRICYFTSRICVVWSWRLKGCKSALAVKGSSARLSGREGSDGYAMLMSPNKDETAVHGCHCQGDMAVRMRKVLQTAGLVFECVTCFFRVSEFIQAQRVTKTWTCRVTQ